MCVIKTLVTLRQVSLGLIEIYVEPFVPTDHGRGSNVCVISSAPAVLLFSFMSDKRESAPQSVRNHQQQIYKYSYNNNHNKNQAWMNFSTQIENENEMCDNELISPDTALWVKRRIEIVYQQQPTGERESPRIEWAHLETGKELSVDFRCRVALSAYYCCCWLTLVCLRSFSLTFSLETRFKAYTTWAPRQLRHRISFFVFVHLAIACVAMRHRLDTVSF